MGRCLSVGGRAMLTGGVPLAVSVQHVQRRDEELVGVLLLVAR